MRHTRSYELKVPICDKCKSAINKKRFIGFVSIVLLGVAGWFGGSLLGGEYHIWGAIAGVIVGVIAASVVFFESAPGEIAKNGLPKFKNAEFHARFVAINNINPAAYDAAEDLDPRLFEEAEREIENRKQYAEEYSRLQRDTESVTDAPSYKPKVILEFGEGTSFLKFDQGMESQYKAHLRLAEHLKTAGVYPELSVCGMIAVSNASCARLIIVTGSTNEIARLPQVFYSTEAERFVNEEFAGDWSAITPASTISNVAEAGMGVDIGPYNELSQEIRRGGFEFDKTL